MGMAAWIFNCFSWPWDLVQNQQGCIDVLFCDFDGEDVLCEPICVWDDCPDLLFVVQAPRPVQLGASLRGSSAQIVRSRFCQGGDKRLDRPSPAWSILVEPV